MAFLGEAREDVWSRVLEQFFQARMRRGLALVTLERDRRVLGRFRAFLLEQGVDEPAWLTSSHLEAWDVFLRDRWFEGRAGRRARLLSPAARFGYMSIVLGLVKFLVQRDYTLVDPRIQFQRSREHREIRRVIPTIEEIRRLLDSIEVTTPRNIRDRAVLELLYSSGLREAEARQLDISDLDLGAGHLRVREGKGGRDRLVPLGERARAALEAYLTEARPLWWNSDSGNVLLITQAGRRLHRMVIQRICRRWCRITGVPRFSPHGLRHACATHLLLGGADIRHIMEILGHLSIQTTQRYTHLTPTDLMNEHQRCHPRGER